MSATPLPGGWGSSTMAGPSKHSAALGGVAVAPAAAGSSTPCTSIEGCFSAPAEAERARLVLAAHNLTFEDARGALGGDALAHAVALGHSLRRPPLPRLRPPDRPPPPGEHGLATAASLASHASTLATRGATALGGHLGTALPAIGTTWQAHTHAASQWLVPNGVLMALEPGGASPGDPLKSMLLFVITAFFAACVYAALYFFAFYLPQKEADGEELLPTRGGVRPWDWVAWPFQPYRPPGPHPGRKRSWNDWYGRQNDIKWWYSPDAPGLTS